MPQRMSSASKAKGIGIDEAFVERMLADADPNVLRIALFQATHAPELAAMKVVKEPVRGGVLIADVLASEHHATVRAIARDLVLSGALSEGSPPSDDETSRLMELFSGETLDPKFLAFGKEELAFDEFPRRVDWRFKPSQKTLENFHVTIVGAGICGLAAAVQLNRLGIPYTIIERYGGLGGTWWRNTYPGCRVDTTSYLYQFKFERKYPWPQHYATAAETLAYLNHIADKYDVRSHIELNTELVAAKWCEEASQWEVTTRSAEGLERHRRSNFLFSAVGVFHTPKVPQFEGMDDYRGSLFHTTAWDHALDLSTKRVGIIGNGSTGAQLMPTVAKHSRSVVAFQRTPQWIMPAENYGAPVSASLSWLFDTIPYYWNWHCYSEFATAMRLQGLMVYDPQWQSQGGRVNERNDTLRKNLLGYIDRKLSSRPELREKVLPPFAPFGRRSVIDSGWYEALLSANVELETSEIERFTAHGIRMRNGHEHQLDVVVLATGFHPSKFLWPVDYAGRAEAKLEDVWGKDGARAYLGMTMPGFPNFFMFWGPNGAARNGGYYSWAEIWSRYVLSTVVELIESGKSKVEVKETAFRTYNEALDTEMQRILWSHESKGSYYQNDFGRMDLAAPWRVEDYHAMLKQPNFSDFEFR